MREDPGTQEISKTYTAQVKETYKVQNIQKSTGLKVLCLRLYKLFQSLGRHNLSLTKLASFLQELSLVTCARLGFLVMQLPRDLGCCGNHSSLMSHGVRLVRKCFSGLSSVLFMGWMSLHQ